MSTDCACCMKIGKTRCRLESVLSSIQSAVCSLQSPVYRLQSSVRQLVLQRFRDHRHRLHNDHHDDRGSFSPLINFLHNLCGISCQKLQRVACSGGWVKHTRAYILEWLGIYEFALGTAALINSNEHHRVGFGAHDLCTSFPIRVFAREINAPPCGIIKKWQSA